MNENNYVDINAHDNYPDSDQKIEIPTMKVIPLKKICMTIGEIPTSYLETMTYYEMLVWFIEYLKNNIIPTVNNNAEAIQEVQTVVLALQNYINNFKDSIDQDVEDLEEYMNNYFENLDVQEEINNKLDDMLEDGVLEQIIEQFIQSSALWCFDTVSDMKSATNLVDGSYAKTLGYYSVNDNGSAIYKIVENEPEDEYYETLESGLYALLVIEDVMNSKQLGMQENTDVTTKLQKFFDLAFKYREKEFDLIGGNYEISGTININPYSKIKLLGTTYITDNNENEITFNIISDVNEENSDEQTLSYLFDNSDGCLILKNNKTSLNKIAISITSVSATPYKRINSNISGINPREYKIGLSLNTFNTYCMEFKNCDFSFCEIGVYIGKNGSIINSGENIIFTKCVFTRCDCCIYNPLSIKTDYHECSFDFNSCVLYIPNSLTSSTTMFRNCWIEGTGFKNVENNNVTSYNGFSGLVYAANDSYWYNKNIVNFESCYIVHLKGKRTSSYCTGTSLILSFTNCLFWYEEVVARDESITGIPANQLFLANNVRNISMKNNNYRVTSHFLPSSNTSLINALLTDEELDTTGSTIGAITNDYFVNFDIDSLGVATSTTIKKVEVDGVKCIELTPPYNGAASNITLISKKYFPIKDAYRYYANCGLKGFKNTNHTFVDFGIKFYDKDLNLLHTKSLGSSYRSNTTGMDNTKFMFASNLQDCYNNEVPSNAVYCRFTYKLVALSGNDTNWNQPVYYSGFYAYTE